MNSSTRSQKYISPFRYPGGKSWFVASFKCWLAGTNAKKLIEPFAGGASVSLSCLEAGDCEQVVLVEKDPNVAAVWRTILGSDAPRLIQRIKTFRPSKIAVRKELNHAPRNSFELAWHTLLRNRISHGGNTAPGAGVLKHGENGKGLRSRWYPATLVDRIRRIRKLKSRITFIEGDGFDYLSSVQKNGPWKGSVFFVDPPYPRAGERLYRLADVDHDKLLNMLSTLSHPFLATYERAAKISRLAAGYQFHLRTTGMRTKSHRHRRELLISNRPFRQ